MRKFVYRHRPVAIFLWFALSILIEFFYSILRWSSFQYGYMVLFWWGLYFFFKDSYNPVTLNYLLSLGKSRADIWRGLWSVYLQALLIQFLIGFLFGYDLSELLLRSVLLVGIMLISMVDKRIWFLLGSWIVYYYLGIVWFSCVALLIGTVGLKIKHEQIMRGNLI
mgnify:FL=1